MELLFLEKKYDNRSIQVCIILLKSITSYPCVAKSSVLYQFLLVIFITFPALPKLHTPGTPQIKEGPTDVDVKFGGTAYFTCKVEGDPEPEVIWLHKWVTLRVSFCLLESLKCKCCGGLWYTPSLSICKDFATICQSVLFYCLMHNVSRIPIDKWSLKTCT